MRAESEVVKSVGRLTALSEANGGKFLARFEWPGEIPADAQWIPDELLTVYGTELFEELDEETKSRLRKWESINFYSQNVHGEKILSRDLVTRIYNSEYLRESQYLFHFLREENEHMSMFAEFCSRYGEILPNSRIDLGRKQQPHIEDFLLFCRTILFEFYVDFYNKTAARSNTVPQIVAQINHHHHIDESRHVLFSKQMIQDLYDRLKMEITEEALDGVRLYVEEYMINQIELVYSTSVYERAGIKNPAEFRKTLLQHPGRRAVHLQWVQQPYTLFKSIGLFGKRTDAEIIDGYFLPQQEMLKRAASKTPKLAIKEWLQEQAGSGQVIGDDFDILEAGLVDSLKFMRFIMFIEKVSGKEMRLDEIDLDDIRTIDAIEMAFL